MFEQAFKKIDDVLRKEAGCTTELDYTQQTSWLLFLEYLDGLEEDKATEARLEGKKYPFMLDKASGPNTIEYKIGEIFGEIKNKISSGYNLDVIPANPPFGGGERKDVQQNFDIRTGETAFLFLQHFIKMLKAGGRAGVVIENTFLSNSDNASVLLRKLFLESCDLQAVLDCPGGTLQGAGDDLKKSLLHQAFSGAL